MKPANNEADLSPSSASAASSPAGGAGGGGAGGGSSGTGIRNRLQKKMGLGTANRGGAGGHPVMPLQEHENFNNVPNPYAAPPPPTTVSPHYQQQQQQYSPDFMTGSPTYGGAPGVPPKVPMEYNHDMLSREISSIDIGSSGGGGGRYPGGGGGGGGVPPPTAYVPVRSQRDRGTYY